MTSNNGKREGQSLCPHGTSHLHSTVNGKAHSDIVCYVLTRTTAYFIQKKLEWSDNFSPVKVKAAGLGSMLMNEGWRQGCQELTADRLTPMPRVKVQPAQTPCCKLSGQDKKPVQTAILERGKSKCDLRKCWLHSGQWSQGCFLQVRVLRNPALIL